MAKRLAPVVAAFVLSLFAGGARAQDVPRAQRPLILAHYMPWYEAKPVAPAWGWHWTMNAFDPDRVVDGRRAIASKFYPTIEPYDSSDPAVLELHLLTMKLAGIDGVIIDWYGLTDFRDYPSLHRATTRLIERAEQLGMKFAVCYEDQTIPALVDAGELKPAERVAHARREIAWLDKNWFASPASVRFDDRPLLLSFGQTGLTDDEWQQALADGPAVSYFSQHHRRQAAAGAFDWPIPKEGRTATSRFLKQFQGQPNIPVAYPRFVDIYAEAKVHDSYGQIEDDEGRTFETTLEQALASGASIVQIATWNDWGEGTQIEPSREHGDRDLRTIQRLRKRVVDKDFAFDMDALELPARLYAARRKATDAKTTRALDAIATAIAQGRLGEARSLLKAIAP